MRIFIKGDMGELPSTVNLKTSPYTRDRKPATDPETYIYIPSSIYREGTYIRTPN